MTLKMNHKTSNALVLSLIMALIIIGAFAFEHIGGFLPCKLCLAQRVPYYGGTPLMLIAALLFHKNHLSGRFVVLFVILLMGYGMILAIYHTGVEFSMWQGPQDCSAAVQKISNNVSELQNSLNKVTPPSCTKPALYVFGVSLAFWNSIISFALILFCLKISK
jgi:disulfide bond formation protein DsbB